ncbi:hypothetical protein ACHAPU_002653 [Fusarium lateritium]
MSAASPGYASSQSKAISRVEHTPGAALRPWADDEDFEGLEDFTDFPPGNIKPEGVHRFSIAYGWTPYTQWYNTFELQDPKTRANVDRPWFAMTPLKQNDSGVWEDPEWMKDEEPDKDRWCHMDYDESFSYAASKWVSTKGAKYGLQDWVAVPKPDPELKA